MVAPELIFIVTEAEEGGYNARAVGHGIFTQAQTREELEANVREAVQCHFEPEEAASKFVHLHYVHGSSMKSADKRAWIETRC